MEVGHFHKFQNRIVITVLFLFESTIIIRSQSSQKHIEAVLPSDANSMIEPKGIISVAVDESAKIMLVGRELTDKMNITFPPQGAGCNSNQDMESIKIMNVEDGGKIAYADILFNSKDKYLMCLHFNSSASHKVTIGNSDFYILVHEKHSQSYTLGFYNQIIICSVLLVFSGLFSGLNLGLMALDVSELEVIKRAGTKKEKKYADIILPVRRRGNFLLCTLLLGNVLVNNSFTLLFEQLATGIYAVIFSTLGIVVFGEIIPQAVCSRHGLAVGAYTISVTKIFMVITFSLSLPISLLLDCLLGDDVKVLTRGEIQEMVKQQAAMEVLDNDEAKIISGALQLANITVGEVMTALQDVYMLEMKTQLDFDQITEIIEHGYTRIPVYEVDKTNIRYLLNTKYLALIDPDDRLNLYTICKYYDQKPLFVGHDWKLDRMLHEFLKEGNSHMAIVQQLHNDDDTDPYFETLGVVTLEDVIEEILQSEIIDETDMMTDNRKKTLMTRGRQDYSMFGREERTKLPKQLAFVAFQFLTTTVEPFSEEHVSRTVLKNLMKKDIVLNLHHSPQGGKSNYIMQKGVNTDKFVLILQGTVEVTIGDEGLEFEQGAFSYFGAECFKCQSKGLEFKRRSYAPDYSVMATSDVQYLAISRSQYMAAVRTTRMLQRSGGTRVEEAYDAEYKKIASAGQFNNNASGGAGSRDSTGSGTFDNHPSPHSPPAHKSALDLLKQDIRTSTSSLDRLSLFSRRPHEILARMRRSGSDAKERSVGYFEDLASVGAGGGDGGVVTGNRPRSDSRERKRSSGGSRGGMGRELSRVSDNSLHASGDHKECVIVTVEDGLRSDATTMPVCSDTAVVLPPASPTRVQVTESSGEGGRLSTAVVSSSPQETKSKKITPAVDDLKSSHECHPAPLGVKVVSPSKKGSLASAGRADAEREPLMNQDRCNDDLTMS